tara:strand:+ start:414 stop:794 length:381 start_codon:yes stop_codon:yes gene_type:complete
MAFTALEWIVLIFALIGLIKLVVIFVNKKQWLPVIGAVYGNPKVWSFVFLILSGLVFYYLIQELSIVQILAVMAFTSMFIAIAFMQYSNELMGLAKKMLNKKWSEWLWVYVVIWMVLLIWGLMEIF